MAEAKTMRLNKVLREFNISLDRAVDFLNSQGHEIDARPTTKISEEVYQVLFDQFETDKSKKIESKEVGEEKRKEKEELRLERERELEEKQKKEEASRVIRAGSKLHGPKKVGMIDLDAPRGKQTPPVEKVEEKPEVPVEEVKEKPVVPTKEEKPVKVETAPAAPKEETPVVESKKPEKITEEIPQPTKQ